MFAPSRLGAFFFLQLAAVALPAEAAIYKYVNADGVVTYSDKYRPGASKLMEAGNGAVIVRTPRTHGSVSTAVSPANFPRVDAGTQRRRDDGRRAILLEERATEAKNLAAAQAALSSAAKQRPAADIIKLSEGVRLHEKNIEMLDKELARLR